MIKQQAMQVRHLLDRLGFRLAFVFAVTLLPLMIVSIVRSQSVMEQALQRTQSALVGETLRAVQSQVILIEQAKAVAQSLSHSAIEFLDDPEACSALMRAKLLDTAFSFAGFYDLTGYVPCSSAAEPFRFEMNDDLRDQIANPAPVVLVNEAAPISGTSVIYAAHPVYVDGSVIGFTAVSVPHSRLNNPAEEPTKAQYVTFNALGIVLTVSGNTPNADDILPMLEPGETLPTLPPNFLRNGRDGESRVYAVVPVVEGELFALATWPEGTEINGNFYFSDPAFFPILMWVASLAVALIATRILVTRHVLKLRSAMQNFSTSRRITEIKEFRDAPAELRDVAGSYVDMTDDILRDEAKLEDAVHQKDVLLREVHHRVKNNLQLITSIMSMQMRQSRSPEVQRLLRGLHDRVNALATIHRSLYQTTGQADVQMDEHLQFIVDHVVRMGADRAAGFVVDTDVAPLRLNPDQAVPLSLFVTEAMTNALKYIGQDATGKSRLRVRLTLPDAQTAKVEIINTVARSGAEPDPDKSSGLGSDLMDAFAGQLDGTVARRLEPGQFYVTLLFPPEALTAKTDPE